MKNPGDSGIPRQGYPKFKLVGVNRVGLWAWPKSGLYRSGIGIIPSGTVVVFLVIRGPSWRIGLSLTQDSGINSTEVSLLKIIFISEFE